MPMLIDMCMIYYQHFGNKERKPAMKKIIIAISISMLTNFIINIRKGGIKNGRKTNSR